MRVELLNRVSFQGILNELHVDRDVHGVEHPLSLLNLLKGVVNSLLVSKERLNVIVDFLLGVLDTVGNTVQLVVDLLDFGLGAVHDHPVAAGPVIDGAGVDGRAISVRVVTVFDPAARHLVIVDLVALAVGVHAELHGIVDFITVLVEAWVVPFAGVLLLVGFTSHIITSVIITSVIVTSGIVASVVVDDFFTRDLVKNVEVGVSAVNFVAKNVGVIIVVVVSTVVIVVVVSTVVTVVVDNFFTRDLVKDVKVGVSAVNFLFIKITTKVEVISSAISRISVGVISSVVTISVGVVISVVVNDVAILISVSAVSIIVGGVCLFVVNNRLSDKEHFPVSLEILARNLQENTSNLVVNIAGVQLIASVEALSDGAVLESVVHVGAVERCVAVSIIFA